jgi:ribosome biogenesis GTPase
MQSKRFIRKIGMTPFPGDKVKFDVTDEENDLGYLDEILERKNVIIRPPVVNLDQVLIVVAMNSPKIDRGLLDKLLITAEQKGIEVGIIINKIDLDEEEEYKLLINDYINTNYKILLLDSINGIGFEEFDEILRGKTTVFAGQSGVGKSTILNEIMNSDIMATGTVSKKTSRGRHTTRHVELVPLKNGGYLVDTPGFSSFEMDSISHDQLENYFPEFSNYLNGCKFTGCSHVTEPKCLVRDALSRGEISQNRYDKYCEVYNELLSNYKNRYSK